MLLQLSASFYTVIDYSNPVTHNTDDSIVDAFAVMEDRKVAL